MTDYERLRERLQDLAEEWGTKEFAKRSEAEYVRRLEGNEDDTPETRAALNTRILHEVEAESERWIEAELSKIDFDENGNLKDDLKGGRA